MSLKVSKDKDGIVTREVLTKKDRSLELKSVAHECQPGPRKVAVKVVDIFGNDTMTIVEVNV